MRVHGEQAHARGIYARNDQVCADMALVAEEMLLQHSHAGNDAGFAARGQGVQLEVGGDDGGCEFRVGGRSGAGTPYLRGDVVEFFTVLRLDVSQLVVGRRIWIRSWVRTLSATMGPAVALVSAAITTPPSKIQPTMVVPVLVALGNGTPCACRAAFRL